MEMTYQGGTTSRNCCVQKLLEIFDIENLNARPCISLEVLQDPERIKKVREIIPMLRTMFKVSKHRCLSPSGWDHAKNPVLNLLRQLLRTIGYKLAPLNLFHGVKTDESGKKHMQYKAMYIILPINDHPAQEAGGRPPLVQVRHDVALDFG